MEVVEVVVVMCVCGGGCGAVGDGETSAFVSKTNIYFYLFFCIFIYLFTLLYFFNLLETTHLQHLHLKEVHRKK